MSKENKTLFSNTQVIIISVTVLILGIGLLYVIMNQENDNDIVTEVQEPETAQNETSSTEVESDDVDSVQLSDSKSYTYEQRTAIDDVIDYIQTGQRDYLAPRAYFDEENGVATVGIVNVDYKLDFMLSQEGDSEHLQNWQSHIEHLSEWSREFAAAGQDYEMEMHVVGIESDNELLFVFENGKLLYDVLNDGE